MSVEEYLEDIKQRKAKQTVKEYLQRARLNRSPKSRLKTPYCTIYAKKRNLPRYILTCL